MSVIERAKHGLMRHLPHAALRAGLNVMEVRHHRVVHRIRRELGLRRPPLQVQTLRRGDTVFLLGSGASINAIDADRWKGIAASDSIGLNFWIRHPFVPTLYFFEACPPSLFQRLRDLVNLREQEYRSVVKIATSHVNYSPFLERQFGSLPESWRAEMWPLDSKTIFARNDAELRQELSRLLRSGLFVERGPVSCLFKYMGTMTSLISMSVSMGYRNIVMCGVDLTNSGYFYHDESRFPDMKGFISSYPRKRHYLMADDLPHCGADLVITALDDLVVKPSGARLYVENASSALYPDIPVAPDDLFVSSP